MPRSEFAGVTWRKSTRSNNECVEVAITPDVIGVRDSKDPAGPVLSFTPDAWAAFLAGVEDGDFAL